VSRDALCNLDTDLTEFVSGLCDFLQNMCHGWFCNFLRNMCSGLGYDLPPEFLCWMLGPPCGHIEKWWTLKRSNWVVRMPPSRGGVVTLRVGCCEASLPHLWPLLHVPTPLSSLALQPLVPSLIMMPLGEYSLLMLSFLDELLMRLQPQAFFDSNSK
jgi:hypothetical protein